MNNSQYDIQTNEDDDNSDELIPRKDGETHVQPLTQLLCFVYKLTELNGCIGRLLVEWMLGRSQLG